LKAEEAADGLFDLEALEKLDKQPKKPKKRKAPVLVCFYSGGFRHADGVKLLKDITDGAAQYGLREQLVLGFPDYYDMTEEGYEPWPKYVDRLVQEIDTTKDYKSRPLILFGHSRGAEAALSLATRLGDRVLKIYIAACGPIKLGVPTGWENLSKNFKVGGTRALLTWFATLQPGNILLSRTSRLPLEEMEAAVKGSKWLTDTVNVMAVQYKDAMFPNMTADEPHIAMVSCPIVAVSPLYDGGCQPDLAAEWTHNTCGQFQMITVAAGHMDCLTKNADLMDRLGPDMVAVAEDRDDIPLIPLRSAREEAEHQKWLEMQEAQKELERKNAAEEAIVAKRKQALAVPEAIVREQKKTTEIVEVDKETVSIVVDSIQGPMFRRPDGTSVPFRLADLTPASPGVQRLGGSHKEWYDLSSTEREVLLDVVARHALKLATTKSKKKVAEPGPRSQYISERYANWLVA